jgi:hypothetical protein
VKEPDVVVGKDGKWDEFHSAGGWDV